MQPQTLSRLRVITPIVVCVAGLLLWSCSSSPPEVEQVSYSCASPPADLTGCSVDADCATIATGCYCGAQPVNGVARKYMANARTCEETAASTCALGCATESGQVAQDGTKADVGSAFAARCDHSGATGVCKSYAPPPGGGSGDPTPTGW